MGFGRSRRAAAEASGQQRGAEDHQAEGGDSRGDLWWGVADGVVKDEDPAQLPPTAVGA